MSNMHVGIDLGTTNTVIATCKPRKNSTIGYLRSIVRDVNQYIEAKQMGVEKSLPSVLFFDSDGIIKVGNYARRKKREGADKRVLYNTKIDMGQKKTYENGFTPVAAAAEILKVCRNSIKSYISKTEEFPDVTITVPASFTQSQIADTLEAAKQAGFDTDKISILEEPVAALYSYINDLVMSGENDIIDFSETKRILVYDIGGGTCDACIVDLRIDENFEFDIQFVATNRYTEFGGNDFDEQVAIGLLNKLFQRYDVNESDIDSPQLRNQLVASILPFCEQYKIDYSNQLAQDREDEEITDAFFGDLPSFLTKYENVELDVTYEEYKEFTKVFFQDNYTHPTRNLKDKMRDKNVIKPVYQLLKHLDSMGERTIDCIFLTGGMSKYLPIEQALQNFCKCPILKTESPMESVAMGAAMSNFIKTKNHEHAQMTNVKDDVDQQTAESIGHDRPRLAESIFIDVENSLPMKIIDANTDIPCSGKVAHLFHVGANGVSFNLFAGQTEWDPEMRILYDYSIKFDFLVPPNTGAEILYEIDENRFLKLYLELKDFRKQKLQLTVDTMRSEK